MKSDAAGGPDDAVEKEKVRLSRLSMHAFMAENKRFKVVSGSLTDLITKYAMHNIIEHVLDIEDADAYVQMKTSWGKHLCGSKQPHHLPQQSSCRCQESCDHQKVRVHAC